MFEILFSFCNLVFELYEVFDVEVLIQCLCFVEYSCEIFDVVFGIVWSLVEKLFVLYNCKGDEYELFYENGLVMLILEVKLVVDVFFDVGFFNVICSFE